MPGGGGFSLALTVNFSEYSFENATPDFSLSCWDTPPIRNATDSVLAVDSAPVKLSLFSSTSPPSGTNSFFCEVEVMLVFCEPKLWINSFVVVALRFTLNFTSNWLICKLGMGIYGKVRWQAKIYTKSKNR